MFAVAHARARHTGYAVIVSAPHDTARPGPFVVLLDASPAVEPVPWMVQTCARVGVPLVVMRRIHARMRQDDRAYAAFQLADRYGENPELPEHYLRAFHQELGTAPWAAVDSFMWLSRGLRPAVAVLDLDYQALERSELEPHLGRDRLDLLVARQRLEVVASVQSVLPPERILRLPLGSSDTEKTELATGYLERYRP